MATTSSPPFGATTTKVDKPLKKMAEQSVRVWAPIGRVQASDFRTSRIELRVSHGRDNADEKKVPPMYFTPDVSTPKLGVAEGEGLPASAGSLQTCLSWQNQIAVRR